MRYLIIGLGIYGQNLARDLQDMGHEVVGVDSDESRVDQMKDTLASVYCVDTTEASALNVLPYKNCDLVVVCIGENFGASVKTVALLKQAGVKHIYARAIDPLNQAILECFELDRILMPEQHAAAIELTPRAPVEDDLPAAGLLSHAGNLRRGDVRLVPAQTQFQPHR